MGPAGRRIADACQVLTIAVACLGGFFAAGCDECEEGQRRCDGDSVFTCNTDEEGAFGKNRWVEQPCAVTCRVLGGHAVCVSSREPVAACANVSGTLCLDGVPSSCTEGYLFQGSACAAGTVCVKPPTCNAMCAASDTPEPRCSARSFCDGSGFAICSCGYVTDRLACAGTDTCHETGGDAQCTIASAPDPRCGSSSQQWSSFCGDGLAYGCWYGYVISSYDCTAVPCFCQSLSCPVTAEQAATCPSATAGHVP